MLASADMENNVNIYTISQPVQKDSAKIRNVNSDIPKNVVTKTNVEENTHANTIMKMKMKTIN